MSATIGTDGGQITVTPVLGIDEFGLSSGLVGAVDLQPTGLQFARPALLRIATTETAGAGERLAGFAASGRPRRHR